MMNLTSTFEYLSVHNVVSFVDHIIMKQEYTSNKGWNIVNSCSRAGIELVPISL